MESHLVLKLRFPWKGDKIIGIWFWKDNFKSLVVKLFGDENALYISFCDTEPAVEGHHHGVPQFFWTTSTFLKYLWQLFYIISQYPVAFMSEILLKVSEISSSWFTAFVLKLDCPANIYLFKFNNRNGRNRCEICSKLTLKTPYDVVMIFLLITLNIFHITFLVFLLLNLNLNK